MFEVVQVVLHAAGDELQRVEEAQAFDDLDGDGLRGEFEPLLADSVFQVIWEAASNDGTEAGGAGSAVLRVLD